MVRTKFEHIICRIFIAWKQTALFHRRYTVLDTFAADPENLSIVLNALEHPALLLLEPSQTVSDLKMCTLY